MISETCPDIQVMDHADTVGQILAYEPLIPSASACPSRHPSSRPPQMHIARLVALAQAGHTVGVGPRALADPLDRLPSSTWSGAPARVWSFRASPGPHLPPLAASRPPGGPREDAWLPSQDILDGRFNAGFTGPPPQDSTEPDWLRRI